MIYTAKPRESPRRFDPCRDHIASKYRAVNQRGIFFVRIFVPPGVSLGPVFAENA